MGGYIYNGMQNLIQKNVRKDIEKVRLILNLRIFDKGQHNVMLI